MSLARKSLNWEAQSKLSIDPEHFQTVHGKHASMSKACSMCGGFCAMALVEEYLGVSAPRC
jgi:phosphomethylpyrimidine synthase